MYLLPSFPITIVQYQNEEIDIGTIHWLIHISQALHAVCVCVCVCVCV